MRRDPCLRQIRFLLHVGQFTKGLVTPILHRASVRMKRLLKETICAGMIALPELVPHVRPHGDESMQYAQVAGRPDDTECKKCQSWQQPSSAAMLWAVKAGQSQKCDACEDERRIQRYGERESQSSNKPPPAVGALL